MDFVFKDTDKMTFKTNYFYFVEYIFSLRLAFLKRFRVMAPLKCYFINAGKIFLRKDFLVIVYEI